MIEMSKTETKKLNLEWVSDVIKDDYKTWRKGDVVTLCCQTGTGKTEFVKTKLLLYMEEIDKGSQMLILCNRVNLKRQLKKDLFIHFGVPLPNNIEDLDSVDKIGSVKIMSYQALSNIINAESYGGEKFDLNKFKYIIADECHFLMSDSGFNNKCDLVFNELVRVKHKNAIKLFISATMEEMIQPILKGIENMNKFKGLGERSIKNISYSTDIDYSYLNVKYFRDIKNIVQLIKNDKTEDKWLVFVTNKDKGNEIVEDLRDICSANFIDKDTKLTTNEDLKSIIENSKFISKVLVCTKAMDNGINIKDLDVKHIVVMSYDKTSFIQEVGRLRVDISNAHKINLYIPTCKINTFSTILETKIAHKFNIIDLLRTDEEAFKQKYDRDFNGLPRDIFIKEKDGNFIININGYARLWKDKMFAEKIYQAMLKDKMAYVREQLEWLGLGDTFDESNLIEDVIDEVNKSALEDFLKDSYDNEMLYDKKVFLDKINSIVDNDDNLKVLCNKISGNSTNKGRGAKVYNNLMEQLELPYVVSSIVRKESKNGKRKNITYWIIGRV